MTSVIAFDATALYFFLLLLLLYSSTAATSKPLLQPPAVFPSKDGVTRVNLSVRVRRVSIPLESELEVSTLHYTGRFYYLLEDDATRRNSKLHLKEEHSSETSFSSDAVPLGPTIHVIPGGTLELTLRNELEEEDAEELEDSSRLSSCAQDNPVVARNVNHTALHFHGLRSARDATTTLVRVAPGKEQHYTLPILKDEYRGLHWYHAAAASQDGTSSGFMQVMGGLFGAMTTGVAQLLNGYDSIVLAISEHRFARSIPAWSTGVTLPEAERQACSGIASDPILEANGQWRLPPSSIHLVNGQHRPHVHLKEGHRTLIKFVYAAATGYVRVAVPDVCTFHAYATDGEPLALTREVHSLYFATGSRIETVAICISRGVFPVHIVSDDDDQSLGDDVLLYFDVNVKSQQQRNDASVQTHGFEVDPDAASKVQAIDNSSQRQLFRHDISFSSLGGPLNAGRRRVIGHGNDCSSLRNDSTCFYQSFVGGGHDSYYAQPQDKSTEANLTTAAGHQQENNHDFVVPMNSIVEARLYGDPLEADSPSAFHLHGAHFEFVSFTPRIKGVMHARGYDPTSQYGVQPGQLLDTIPLMDGVTIVRWLTPPFTGEHLFGCGAMDSADAGMQGSYHVVAQQS